MNETLNLFLSDSKHLRDLHKRIEEFEEGGKMDSLERIAAEVAKVVAAVKEKQKEAEATKLKLENANKVVDDQERQRKLLRDNIDLHKSEAQFAHIEKQVQELEQEEAAVEGADTAKDLMREAEERIRASKNEASGLEGERRAISEQVTALRRKLRAPEYRDVEKQHKEALS